MQALADTAAVLAPRLETIPKLRFLFWAYVAIFAIIAVYLVTIHVRQRKLDREIAALNRRLAAGG
jgi:CcmD family protein